MYIRSTTLRSGLSPTSLPCDMIVPLGGLRRASSVGEKQEKKNGRRRLHMQTDSKTRYAFMPSSFYVLLFRRMSSDVGPLVARRCF